MKQFDFRKKNNVKLFRSEPLHTSETDGPQNWELLPSSQSLSDVGEDRREKALNLAGFGEEIINAARAENLVKADAQRISQDDDSAIATSLQVVAEHKNSASEEASTPRSTKSSPVHKGDCQHLSLQSEHECPAREKGIPERYGQVSPKAQGAVLPSPSRKARRALRQSRKKSKSKTPEGKFVKGKDGNSELQGRKIVANINFQAVSNPEDAPDKGVSFSPSTASSPLQSEPWDPFSLNPELQLPLMEQDEVHNQESPHPATSEVASNGTSRCEGNRSEDWFVGCGGQECVADVFSPNDNILTDLGRDSCRTPSSVTKKITTRSLNPLSESEQSCSLPNLKISECQQKKMSLKPEGYIQTILNKTLDFGNNPFKNWHKPFVNVDNDSSHNQPEACRRKGGKQHSVHEEISRNDALGTDSSSKHCKASSFSNVVESEFPSSYESESMMVDLKEKYSGSLFGSQKHPEPMPSQRNSSGGSPCSFESDDCSTFSDVNFPSAEGFKQSLFNKNLNFGMNPFANWHTPYVDFDDEHDGKMNPQVNEANDTALTVIN